MVKILGGIKMIVKVIKYKDGVPSKIVIKSRAEDITIDESGINIFPITNFFFKDYYYEITTYTDDGIVIDEFTAGDSEHKPKDNNDPEIN